MASRRPAHLGEPLQRLRQLRAQRRARGAGGGRLRARRAQHVRQPGRLGAQHLRVPGRTASSPIDCADELSGYCCT